MSISCTSELARVCAELTGDGYIQLKDWRGLTSFYSKHLSEINDFESRFSKIFSICGRIYPDNRNNKRYKLFFISKKVAQTLVSLGVPSGNKTNTPFFVPGWVLSGSSEVKTAYLRGLFNSEGSIGFIKTKSGLRWRIDFEMYKRDDYKKEIEFFMNQLRTILLEFSIICSPVRFVKGNLRKDGTLSIGAKFSIESKSFNNFYKWVGFDTPYKASKLRAFVEQLA